MATIERNVYGGYAVSAIVRGFYVRRVYYGYTRREALRLFSAAIEAARAGGAL
jgi:hypothetical protein